MAGPRPEDFGLSDAAIAEIRARDERQARLFVDLLLHGVGLVFGVLAVVLYVRGFSRSPISGLLVAPLLGALGAAVAGLPIAIASALFSWFLHPRHPLSGALERYEAATAGIRTCDVCRLARGDETAKEGVIWCGRCGAYVCPDCRGRYDLRAIAALKRRAGVGPASPGETP
jgi:hypothetical protein